MRVREIGLSSAGPDDIERWEDLAARAAEPNPFFEPGFARAAAAHLDGPEPTLLAVEDGGRWLACLPVQATRVARLLPAWRTWCHLYCFLGIPLLDTDAAVPAGRALLDHAITRAPGRQLVLELLSRDGVVGQALDEAAADLGLVVTVGDFHERALVMRRAAGGYVDHVRSHHRREIARLGRRLEAQLGALVMSDQAASPDAVERFIALESSGWKGRALTSLGDSPAHAQLFREVCRSFAAQGRLELLELSAGGRAVAMKCNLNAADGGFCFKIAYDEQLGRFSPGVQLEWENVTHFHEQQRVKWQDSCADPDNEMINRLWPDRRAISTTLVARRGARGTVARQAMRGARAIRAVRDSR